MQYDHNFIYLLKVFINDERISFIADKVVKFLCRNNFFHILLNQVKTISIFDTADV